MKLIRQSARNQQDVLMTKSYNWIHRQKVKMMPQALGSMIRMEIGA